QEKILFDELSATILSEDVGADCLIIDLLELYRGYYRIHNAHGTQLCSFNSGINNIITNVKLEHIELEKIDKEFFNLFLNFIQKIKKMFEKKPIFLLKSHLPTHHKKEYGCAILYDDVQKIQKNNKILDKLYERLIAELSGECLHIIDLNGREIAYDTHGWGSALTHFIPDYYFYAIEQMYSILGYGEYNKVSSYNYYEKSKYALLKTPFDKRDPIKSLGNNSGNLVFWSSIEKLFKPDLIPYDFEAKGIDINTYDVVIITDLIWIRSTGSNYEYLEKIIDKIDTKIALMSVGIQSPEDDQSFTLPNDVARILKKVDKQGIIGARGQYTAKILSQTGIKNIHVIGCPSIYYWNNRNFSINDKIVRPISMTSNFRTFYGNLNSIEKEILSMYVMNNSLFVEQNAPHTMKMDAKFTEYLSKKSKIFYNNESWMSALAACTYSLGLRFHGNIMAIRSGIPALFITIDSRTREMTDYLHLPNVSLDFCKNKTLDDLIKQTTYSEFNKNYPRIFDRFLEFLSQINLEIVDDRGFRPFFMKKNQIILKSCKILDNKIIYDYDVKGPWKKYYFDRGRYSIEYSEKINKIPNSIAILPFVYNILPLSWICDAEIIVDEIDDKAYQYMKYIKKSYMEMFPREKFNGTLTYNKLINNKTENNNTSILLYSGGVDATSSMIDILERDPELFTIRGSDILFGKDDKIAWDIIQNRHKKISEEHNLKYSWCESEFRYVIKAFDKNDEINIDLGRKYDNYWHAFQHGPALISHAIPLAFKKRHSLIYIAGSYNSKYEMNATCASVPQIDENIKAASISVIHNGFGDTRIDKVNKIIDFYKNTNKKIYLRVCWESRTGYNCCICNKCLRTIAILLHNDVLPQDFGFDIKEDMIKKMCERYNTKSVQNELNSFNIPIPDEAKIRSMCNMYKNI
ncbi:MAG: polysaccharide pyruvyl transferase family protein, partial [Candidatus Methanomethylophilus alvus]|nr:polysaccharide pyruvyl transferase family protein [Methanomethylophilus alvi]